MKKIFLLNTIMLLIVIGANAQAGISAKDLQPVIGKWVGSLTYLDYTSNKPYTMEADIEVQQVGTSNAFLFINSFPKEKNANWTDTIQIATNGKKFNEELVVSKTSRKNGAVILVTEVLSKDGNENLPALIRNTYTLSNSVFIKKKEVQFTGKKKWLLRHTYTYKR